MDERSGTGVPAPRRRHDDHGPSPHVALPDATDGLRLVGGFALRRAGVDLELAHSEQRLVALLALRGPLARGRAAGRLWPETDDGHAGAALRTVLWRLRRLDDGLVQTTGDVLRLDPALPVDVARLSRLAQHPEQVAPADLPTGELLPGVEDEWVLEERPHVLLLQVLALEAAGDRLRAQGDRAAALECAHAVLRLDPLRETAHRLVLRVHLDEGNVAQAVRWYEAYAALLREELGLTPSPLMRALLDGDPGDAAVTPR